jgi:hypothetical protein
MPSRQAHVAQLRAAGAGPVQRRAGSAGRLHPRHVPSCETAIGDSKRRPGDAAITDMVITDAAIHSDAQAAVGR